MFYGWLFFVGYMSHQYQQLFCSAGLHRYETERTV